MFARPAVEELSVHTGVGKKGQSRSSQAAVSLRHRILWITLSDLCILPAHGEKQLEGLAQCRLAL